jgi:hypothetical protein
MPEFSFDTNTLQIVFDSPDGAHNRLVSAAFSGKRQTEFRARATAGIDGPIHLVSTKGESRATIQNGTVVGQTSYPQHFTVAAAWQERSQDTSRKLGALLALLEEGGARPIFVALSYIAHMMIEPSQREIVKQRIAESLGMNRLAPGDVAADFQTRMGIGVGDSGFLSMSASWFQLRTYQMPIPTVPQGGIATVSFREWDATLSHEGVEVRFDINNKKGLYTGKRDWSIDELQDVVRTCSSKMPPMLESFERLIRV